MADNWYYAQGQQRVGPMPVEQLIRQLPSVGGPETLVYGPGMKNWARAADVPVLAQALGVPAAGYDLAPPIPPGGGGYGAGQRSHEIVVEIFGNDMQHPGVTLDQGETVIAEPGAMMFMTPGIDMQTVFGDPNKNKS